MSGKFLAIKYSALPELLAASSARKSQGRHPFAHLFGADGKPSEVAARIYARTKQEEAAAKPRPKAASPKQAPVKTQTLTCDPARFRHLIPIYRDFDEAPGEPAPEAKTIDTARATAAAILAAGAYARGETPQPMTAPTIKREMSLKVENPKALAERILAAGRGEPSR